MGWQHIVKNEKMVKTKASSKIPVSRSLSFYGRDIGPNKNQSTGKPACPRNIRLDGK